MSDTAKTALAIGAIIAISLVGALFPVALPQGLLLTDSIIEHLDCCDGFLSL